MKLLQLFFHSTVVFTSFLSIAATKQDTGDFHICYFSLNNEKEFTEMEKFTKKINKHSHCSISVNEYMTENEDPEESFKKMIDSGVRCDGLVISGHHTGSFGGKRSSGSLGIDFLEKLSCDEKYSKWFNSINALWLQGCRTLGTGEIVNEDTEGDADYHTTRVGEVLEEDHLEQSLADLNMEFSATLDQDNPLSSRYLRAFPAATVFGWTKTAPGEIAGSEYSIPFHMAHISRLINNQDGFPTDSPIKGTWTKESAVDYSTSMLGVLNGEVQCQELAVEAWKEHGNVRDQATEYGFFNPDLNAYISLMNTENEILKQARVYDCLLKYSDEEKLLEVLDLILKDQTFIRYTYNSLLERLQELKHTNPELHSKMIEKLKNSKEMKTFLSRKLTGKRLGILRKIDYFAFYEEIYGKNEKIKSLILDKANEAFEKIPSNSYDEQDYKRTLLYSLSKHGYLNNEQGTKLLETVLKDSSPDVRRTAVKMAGRVMGEKAFPLIEKAFEDSSSDVRRAAVSMAGRVMGEKAFPLIEKAFEDSSSDVRRAAVHMADIMGEKAFPLIEKAFEDSSSDVRRAAVHMADIMGEKAFPLIEKAFEDSSFYVRRAAVHMADIMGEKAFPLIEKASKDSSPDVRMAAVSMAGRVMGEKAFPLIEKAFEDSSSDVRMAAVEMAGEVMGEKAFPIVEEAFKDSAPGMRQLAVQQAGKIGEKGLPIVKQAFKDSNPDMRREALNAAGAIGEKGLPIVEQGFKDSDINVRMDAVYVAGEIGEKALPIVEQAFKDSNPDMRREALNAAGAIGEKALPIVEQAFKDSNPDMRREALNAAGAIGEKGLPIVEQGFKDSDINVRMDAVYVAGEIGEKALPIVKQAFKDSAPGMRRQAVYAAGSVGEKALPIVEEAFKDSDLFIQGTAFDAAARIGEKSLPMLRQLLQDEDLDNESKKHIPGLIQYIEQSSSRGGSIKKSSRIRRNFSSGR